MDADARREERTERLKQSRQADSARKRSRAIAAAKKLHAKGLKVDYASVSAAADVSGWLTRNAPDVKKVIEELKADQEKSGRVVAPPPGRQASAASLRNDLTLIEAALAKAEADNATLTAANAKLRDRLRDTLGAEADAATAPELLARVQQLEVVNQAQHEQLLAQERELTELRTEVRELSEELEAKAAALSRMMRTRNSDS